MEPPHKKRGRKPKNNISTQEAPEIHDKSIGNKVLHLKHASTIQHEEMDGIEDQPENATIETTVTRVCWNCHSETHACIGVPVKRQRGVYLTQGSFCSYPCVARYILDTYENKELWKRYNLLAMYYNESMGTVGKQVKPALHKHHLLEYGGTMTREEYSQGDSSCAIIFPPIIPIDNSMCDISTTHHMKTTGDLKLYRKQPLKTNHVLEKMNQ